MRGLHDGVEFLGDDGHEHGAGRTVQSVVTVGSNMRWRVRQDRDGGACRLYGRFVVYDAAARLPIGMADITSVSAAT
jgi:hypothetical protein